MAFVCWTLTKSDALDILAVQKQMSGYLRVGAFSAISMGLARDEGFTLPSLLTAGISTSPNFSHLKAQCSQIQI